jgi:sensor histidine kinase YesM
MPYIKQNKYLKIAAHFGFWLISMGLTLLLFYYYEDRVHFDLVILLKAFITNLGFALAVYINLLVLIPRFLKRKNYVFYVFWLIVVISFSSLFIQFLLMFPLRNILNVGIRFHSFDINLHAAYFSTTFLFVTFTSFLKFIKDWLTMQDLNLKLAKIEQQKLEAELKTLKGQLNPHFLFNSLNNIYSLALVQSEKVPDLILRLADLMRHIIYESREKYIPLEKEIDFVTNFVALQKIRAADNVNIEFNLLGKVPSSKIAPLIFEPFIDNAFKHGLPGTNGKDYIRISFDFETPDWIKFKIENNYEPLPEGMQKKAGGIGIENVKQRLNFLYNSKDYSLKIKHQNNIHLVNLHLKLK